MQEISGVNLSVAVFLCCAVPERQDYRDLTHSYTIDITKIGKLPCYYFPENEIRCTFFIWNKIWSCNLSFLENQDFIEPFLFWCCKATAYSNTMNFQEENIVLSWQFYISIHVNIFITYLFTFSFLFGEFDTLAKNCFVVKSW